MILGAWRMQRISHTVKHRLDPSHVLLIVMVATAVLMVFVGAVQFSFKLPIELD